MISLCMILKNEAKNLAQCLARVTPYFKEIIILDTGSTDETCSIAERWGVKLFSKPFIDFADSRNTALDRATGDWVFVLDPDEEMEKKDLEELIELTRNTSIIGFRIPRYDYIGQYGWALSLPCRLFRRIAGIRYQGILYEEPLLPFNFANLLYTAWNISIHHYGFLQCEEILIKKRSLYRHLLSRNKSIEDKVWNLRIMAMLSADAGDFSQALELITRSVRRASSDEVKTTALVYIRILFAINRWEEALENLDSISQFPNLEAYQRSRVENFRGLALSRLGRWQESREAYIRALNYRIPVTAYYVNLAFAQVRSSQLSEGENSFSIACNLNPKIGKLKLCPSYIYQEKWLHRLETDTRALKWFLSTPDKKIADRSMV